MGYFSEMDADQGTVGQRETDQALDRRDGLAGSECKHPARRLFGWKAFDGTLCICCCECGEVLRGAAE